MRVVFGRARSPETGKLGPLSVHQWGCSKCGREDTSPSKDAPESERRVRRNCDGETNVLFAVTGAPKLRACPWATLTGEDFEAVDQWARWKRLGVWPYPGSGADQPAPVVEAIEICDATADEIRNEQQAPPPEPPKKKKR
jgi:hypothetical protein